MSESIRGSNVSQFSLRVSRIVFNAWIRLIPCRLHIGYTPRSLFVSNRSTEFTIAFFDIARIRRASINFFKRLKNYAHFSLRDRRTVSFLLFLSDIYRYIHI